MRKHKTRAIASGILAALLMSLSGLSAQAAVWVGGWDPQFGSPFTASDPLGYELGWGGKVKINDNACSVPVGGGTISNDGACGLGAFIVPGSLVVTLYQYPDTTPVLKTLTFDATSLSIVDLRYDSNSTLTGFRTGSSGSDWVLDDAAGTSAEFSIGFVLDGNPCLGCDAGLPFDGQLLPSGYDGPVLYARTPIVNVAIANLAAANFVGSYDFYRSDVATYPARISFTPEPGSLALIAVGMIAAGAGARRRRVTHGQRLV